MRHIIRHIIGDAKLQYDPGDGSPPVDMEARDVVFEREGPETHGDQEELFIVPGSESCSGTIAFGPQDAPRPRGRIDFKE
jgi:hypothetical protein